MKEEEKNNNSSCHEEVKAEEKDERYVNTFGPSQRLSDFQKLRPLWKRQGTIIGDLTPPNEHKGRRKKDDDGDGNGDEEEKEDEEDEVLCTIY